MKRPVLRASSVVPLLLLMIVALPSVNPAQAVNVAAGDGIVRVPSTTSQSAWVRLLGVSGGRMAVARDEALLMTGDVNSPGQLSEVGTHRQDTQDLFTANDLRGDVLRWIDGRWTMHTADLATGKQTTATMGDEPLAWTPTGWLGMDGPDLVEHDGDTRTVLFQGIPEKPTFRPDAVSDGERTLLSYNLDDDVRRTVLITDDGREVTELAKGDMAGQYVSGLVLTPSFEIWIQLTADRRGTTLKRRDRSTGAVTTVPTWQPDANLLGSTLLADDDMIVAWEGGRRVHIWDGTAWSSVKFTDQGDTRGIDGIFLDDHTIYFGTGGPIETNAGVYRVGPDRTATRVATVPVVRQVFGDVGLSGGRLYYTERLPGLPQDRGAFIMARTVIRSGDRRPVRLGSMPGGGEGDPVVMYPEGDGRPRMSVSGPRVLLWYGDRFELWNQALGPSYLSEAYSAPRQSGAYSLTAGIVYRAAPVFADEVMDLGDQPADLYGPQVIWRTPAGRLMYRDLSSAHSTRVLAPSVGAGRVAIGRDWYASSDATGLTNVHNRHSKQEREVTSGPVTDLRLNENVLSWTDSDDGVYVLDLDHEDSEPVDSGLRAPYQVDDGLIAGINPDGEIQIQALPFASGGGDSTLISGLAPKKVARARTTWAAQFDVTRPVTDVKVSIRRDGRMIRTLTMPGRYGLINVTWNGRTGSGRKVRPGVFRWTVTGRTPDGHRLSPIRGQLTVT